MEAKGDLAKILMVDHKKIWEGAFRDLKDWIETKKTISANRLPLSEVSVAMGTR